MAFLVNRDFSARGRRNKRDGAATQDGGFAEGASHWEPDGTIRFSECDGLERLVD